MNPAQDSASDDAGGEQAKAVGDLRFLAAALHGSADQMTHGGNADTEIMEFVGWTIYVACRDGLLDSTLDLDKISGPEILQAMSHGIPKLVRREDSSPGPAIVPDVAKTIEKFLQELSAADEEITQVAAASPPALPIDPDVAAECLVRAVWGFVAIKYRDKLPDDIAHSYATNTLLHPFWLQSRAGFNGIAFLCDFLAAKIARQVVGQSEGWVTLSDAEILTGVNKGTLSRSCSEMIGTNDEEGLTIQTNGERGLARRLEVRSLVTFIRHRKEKEIPLGDAEPDPAPERRWVCKSCGESFQTRPNSCKKCRGSTFERERLSV